MASLIPSNGVLVNFAARAEAPSKDYCQLYVTTEQVIFRWWKVSIRNNATIRPGEIKDTHEEFLHDERAQSEIFVAFGQPAVDYVKGLATGHIDYLPRLPEKLLVRIIGFFPLEDIALLSRVSKMFRKLCRSDELWFQLYKDHTQAPINYELETLAEAIGWRKLYFTNKLQLQVLLNRMSSGELSQAAWARHLDAGQEYDKTHPIGEKIKLTSSTPSC